MLGPSDNTVSWMSMRQTISHKCDLFYLTEKRNNEDPSNMSFGISAFVCPSVANLIDSYYGVPILSEGFGSVALGVKTIDGNIVWAVHFPLDFKNKANMNHGYIAMTNLQSVLSTYTGSVCAFGDFNTIAGDVADAIKSAILPTYQFVLDNQLTFFGSYYDRITINPDEDWTQLV
jgi:hypothetical protein